MTEYITKSDVIKYEPNIDQNSITDRIIERAIQNIDSVTYRRIHKKGWENLTLFQQNNIKKACCEQVLFLTNYGDILQSPFKSYSINDVSITLDEGGVRVRNGVAINKEAYNLLLETGLLYRGV